jgi:hypothetical protein
MKKFWLILLSLGLVVAFHVSAFAVDVKVSGAYYAAGMYLNKTNVNDTYYSVKDVNMSPNVSSAFFYQRLRVGTDFIVSPGLKLVTRFDAMERIWGGSRSTTGTALAVDSAATRAENENMAIDWAYINYVSPIGTFDVGYMNYGATGTIFGNSSYPAGRIKYNYSKNSFTIGVDYSKIADNSYSYINDVDYTDADKNVYGIEGTYKFKDGKAGMKINYYRYADKRPSSNYLRKYFLFTPYATAKIGPVALQAELSWATGDSKDYETSQADVELDQLSGWIDATATFAPVYVGATFAYVSGDDPGTTDKEEGGILTGGNDWNPCLIMFNYYDVANWVGTVYGYNSTKVTGPMANAWFFQGRVGVKPTPELDAMLSLSYATVDEKPSGYAHSDYGWEVDLVGTYKITNNLSYMLGIGYLFTGDYFKGTSDANQVNDDFIVMNKLTLTF